MESYSRVVLVASDKLMYDGAMCMNEWLESVLCGDIAMCITNHLMCLGFLYPCFLLAVVEGLASAASKNCARLV